MKDELRKSLSVHDELQRRVRSVQKGHLDDALNLARPHRNLLLVRKRGPYKQRAASVARTTAEPETTDVG